MRDELFAFLLDTFALKSDFGKLLNVEEVCIARARLVFRSVVTANNKTNKRVFFNIS